MKPEFIASRDNAQLKSLRRLSQDSTAYRSQGRLWVEGDHLCAAAVQCAWSPSLSLWPASAWAAGRPQAWASAHALGPEWPGRLLLVDDALWPGLSALGSAADMAMVFKAPPIQPLQPGQATVVLDRLQDPGNVGSVLRSAAAFGFKQVLALSGTAALWSPKTLRAGMGAHFGLRLLEGQGPEALDALGLPLWVTSSHLGRPLSELAEHGHFTAAAAWALGHEGQGICADLMARATGHVRIEQPGGEESLNVAAAAAICLYHARRTG
jgi:TrmH family RNA methyltransferase